MTYSPSSPWLTDASRTRVDQCPSDEVNAARAALGPVVYAVRLDDVIKIGHTAALTKRLSSLRSRQQATTFEVLAVMPGTYDDEQQIHARLVESRAHGWEYYRVTPDVVREVNRLRSFFKLEPITA